jgi:hypothetical protein
VFYFENAGIIFKDLRGAFTSNDGGLYGGAGYFGLSSSSAVTLSDGVHNGDSARLAGTEIHLYFIQ